MKMWLKLSRWEIWSRFGTLEHILKIEKVRNKIHIDYTYRIKKKFTDLNFYYLGDPAADWWQINLTDPIMSGKNYHRCGPDFDFAGCTVNPEKWTTQKPPNGPCCSPNHYCGTTKERDLSY